MTSADLADLNGLLALETGARQRAGDNRDKSLIVDDILHEIGMPDLRLPILMAVRLRQARTAK